MVKMSFFFLRILITLFQFLTMFLMSFFMVYQRHCHKNMTKSIDRKACHDDNKCIYCIMREVYSEIFDFST